MREEKTRKGKEEEEKEEWKTGDEAFKISRKEKKKWKGS